MRQIIGMAASLLLSAIALAGCNTSFHDSWLPPSVSEGLHEISLHW